jgi:hypothetical protein
MAHEVKGFGNDTLNIIGDSYGKGVSVLKACLDHCEEPV